MFNGSWFTRAGRFFSVVGLVACLSFSAHAAQIALFDNGNYVDTDEVDDPCGAEANNLQISIASFGGHTVTPFTGITDADFSAALEGKQFLIIPELEEGDLLPDLSPEARQVIVDFVNSGGRLFIYNSGGDIQDLANTLFGFSLDISGGVPEDANASKTSEAAGTFFEDGAATIPGNDDTAAVSVSSLPANAINVYNYLDGSNDVSALAILPFGEGEIIYFGWDWYGSMPPGGPGDGCEDGLDGGWQALLAAALNSVDADLQISKSADSASVNVGDEVTFTVTVTNNGPSDASEVVVTDNLPASATLVSATASQGSCSGSGPVICDIGDLANGDSATITVVITADVEGTLTNQTEVEALNNDPDPANNTATASVTVTLAPSLISGAGCNLATGIASGASLSGAWFLALAAFGILRGLRTRP